MQEQLWKVSDHGCCLYIGSSCPCVNTARVIRYFQNQNIRYFRSPESLRWPMLWVGRRRRSLSVVRRPLSSFSQNLLGQSLPNFVCIAPSGEGNNLLLSYRFQSLGDLCCRVQLPVKNSYKFTIYCRWYIYVALKLIVHKIVKYTQLPAKQISHINIACTIFSW